MVMFFFTVGVERNVAKLWLSVAGTLVVCVSPRLPLFLNLMEVAVQGGKGSVGEG